jgi:hypothetical protein
MSTFTAIEAARKQTSGERNANKSHLNWLPADDHRWRSCRRTPRVIADLADSDAQDYAVA